MTNMFAASCGSICSSVERSTDQSEQAFLTYVWAGDVSFVCLFFIAGKVSAENMRIFTKGTKAQQAFSVSL